MNKVYPLISVSGQEWIPQFFQKSKVKNKRKKKVRSFVLRRVSFVASKKDVGLYTILHRGIA